MKWLYVLVSLFGRKDFTDFFDFWRFTLKMFEFQENVIYVYSAVSRSKIS